MGKLNTECPYLDVRRMACRFLKKGNRPELNDECNCLECLEYLKEDWKNS